MAVTDVSVDLVIADFHVEDVLVSIINLLESVVCISKTVFEQHTELIKTSFR